jgi:hypothetical protein
MHMGFLRDRLNEAKEAAERGEPERAAEIVGHACFEGPGTFEENLDAMAYGED